MELKQLQYFVTVAEELRSRRAEKRVHIFRTPLGMQIRNLEDELGVQLFYRTSRSLKLTEIGYIFLEEAKLILEKIKTATEMVRSTAKGNTGRIAAGFAGPAMDAFLPGAVREFRRLYPRVTLSLNELSTNAQFDALHSGRIQVGFMRLFHHDIGTLRARVLIREPYVLALPYDHPLAEKQRVSLANLKDIPVIIYPRNIQPELYDGIIASCEVAGFTPNITQEAVTKQTSIALVAAGIGIAFVPASSANLRRPGVVYRPVADELPKVEISMVWQKEKATPLLGRFLEVMRRYERIE
ncbi:Transcriptional activator protein, LysR family [Desulfonema magnum]|uniref:Transcriptional activator protein, LysR family n=2 Tax=Desulfonema magnum TaxID=45655 RepID=A0A975GT47_9BACT|nr:Transcriptional activator protein, LysR family [Desulfonema magnum]